MPVRYSRSDEGGTKIASMPRSLHQLGEPLPPCGQLLLGDVRRHAGLLEAWWDRAGSTPPGGRARARTAAAPRPGSGRRRRGSAGGSGSRSAAARGRAPRPAAPAAGRRRRRHAGSPRSAPRCRGACGAAQTSAAGPDSTIRPRYMTEIASHTWRTIARSCEISSRPMSSSRASRTSRFATWAWAEASSDESGSSSTMHDGSAASARAIAMRWRWPPGELVRVAAAQRPARARPARAARRRARRAPPCVRRASSRPGSGCRSADAG